jgi:Carboxypeptidase regulatory-like domain
MKTKLFQVLIIIVAILLGCRKSDNGSNIGVVKGVVKDASDSAIISNARVLVFDAGTNAPAANSVFTGADGSYSFTLAPGDYYIEVSKQGFENFPPANITAVNFTIAVLQAVTVDIQMNALTTSGLGTISGQVTASSKAASGVLVVASGTSAGYSSVTDKIGDYWIYNVPAGTYIIKAWETGYNSSSVNVTLASSGNSQSDNLDLTAGASGSVSGSVTFLATTNIEVDVSLVNPQTKETITGLTTTTSNYTYTISNVPAGTYVARASYANDGKVMDPDWIVKNGEPTVAVGTTNATMNFTLTGAMNLIGPTNISSKTVPCAISSLTPTFSWSAFTGADDYVIEVSDVNGNVIWGGFNSDGTVKNIVIPGATTSVVYNSDGNALQPLQNGRIYRWRIFASENDISDPRGWKVISASEEQKGLIEVEL